MDCPFKKPVNGVPASPGGGAEEEQDAPGRDLTYHDYLQLRKVLDAQQTKSDVDDEHLFIIIHQVYELWFKQVNYEIDVARKVFEDPKFSHGKLLDIVNRFKRIVMILKLATSQIDILETMTPFDFLQFRRHLFPASGFQSWQFRIMENKLGLKEGDRYEYDGGYKVAFKDQPDNTEKIEASAGDPSFLDYLDGWLRHLLEQQKPNFDFQAKYKEGVDEMLEDIRKAAEAEPDAAKRREKMNEYERKKTLFDSIIDEDRHKERCDERKDKTRKLSHCASLGALMVFLYSGEPAFNLAHQLLHLLMDVDTWIAKWRFSHMMLVQRMIGQLSAGTGGSVGYEYLKGTISQERNKVFVDLFNMSGFLLESKYIKPFSKSS